MTKTEAEELDQFLAELGTNFSKYVRDSISLKQERTPITKRKPIVQPPKADPELLLALGRIGNNLNQVARALNTLKITDRYEEFSYIECLKVLQEIQDQLHETLK